MNQDFNQQTAWSPGAEIIERAQLTKFMRQVGASNHDELYKYSIENVEQFTAQVLKFLDIKFNPPYEKLLDTSNGIQFPKWCVGGGLNITEMCLDRWQTDEMKDQPAIIWENENYDAEKLSSLWRVDREWYKYHTQRTVTYSELKQSVYNTAAGLIEYGLKRGDAIGIYLPMIPETIVALLAIAKIGAVAVPVFSGYGANAIETRMNDVKAKAIFTCHGFNRRGKYFNSFEVVERAVANCPTIERILFIQHGGELSDSQYLDYGFKVLEHEFLMESGKDLLRENENIFEKSFAEDPLMILYTSGTTGKPKGIVHTHCGFPIKAAQDMAFGMDVGRGTRVSWLTDLGWMMGPWLIYGALLNGATICLYDGAPDYPNADRMWEFCAKHEVEVFGISPTLIRTLMTHGDELPAQHDLSRLRVLASTGEPWNETPWRWLFEVVGKSRVPIINYSGGTEISGGILSGNPLLPIKPMSFSAACLGIDVAILDENGAEVERGKVGELAIRKPWIGMARGFYQENERYLETYWSRFENIWVHGDFVIQDADGQFYILGRSDDTLKIAGKRVGPAEVETLLVNHELVVESAVIGVPDDIKGTAMIAFCVVKPNENANLAEELKSLVAEAMGKPLKPNKVLFVNALPKTRNGKVMRRVIRSAYLGEDAGDLSALENPQSVDEIRDAK